MELQDSPGIMMQKEIMLLIMIIFGIRHTRTLMMTLVDS